MALPRKSVLKTSRQSADRVRFDPRDADLLEIRQPSAQRVDVAERPTRVVEPFRVRRNLVAVIGQLGTRVHLAEPIQPKSVRYGCPHVERRHSPASEKPLIGPSAQAIDA